MSGLGVRTKHQRFLTCSTRENDFISTGNLTGKKNKLFFLFWDGFEILRTQDAVS